MELTPSEMAVFGTVSTLVGVLASQAFSLATSHLNRKSEERKHLQQLVITAAMESWRQSCEILKLHPGEKIFRPVDDYMIHMLKLTELIIDEPLTASNIEAKLLEIDALTMTVHRFRAKQEEEDL